MVRELCKENPEYSHTLLSRPLTQLTSMDVQFVEELFDIAIDQSEQELGYLLHVRKKEEGK